MYDCTGILYSDSEFVDLTPSLILVPPVHRNFLVFIHAMSPSGNVDPFEFRIATVQNDGNAVNCAATYSTAVHVLTYKDQEYTVWTGSCTARGVLDLVLVHVGPGRIRRAAARRRAVAPAPGGRRARAGRDV
eukprot:COSAG02_NODE_2823_length_7948_cov_14.628105_2_plen_132_part_00